MSRIYFRNLGDSSDRQVNREDPLPVYIPKGSGTQPAPPTGPVDALLNSTTTAAAASLLVSVDARRVFGLTGFNSSANGQYIQIHDADQLPADGAIPAVVVYANPLSPFSLDFGEFGRYFGTGVVVCNSSTMATKTIGSANCWFDVQFR